MFWLPAFKTGLTLRGGGEWLSPKHFRECSISHGSTVDDTSFSYRFLPLKQNSPVHTGTVRLWVRAVVSFTVALRAERTDKGKAKEVGGKSFHGVLHQCLVLRYRQIESIQIQT